MSLNLKVPIELKPLWTLRELGSLALILFALNGLSSDSLVLIVEYLPYPFLTNNNRAGIGDPVKFINSILHIL